MRFLSILTATICLVVTGCQTTIKPSDPAPIETALGNPERLPTDLGRDVNRRPDAVLAFFGAKPGMTILDMYSGGGYYTEVLSNLVGDQGAVFAHNNQAYLSFAKKELEQRYLPNRLTNVKRILQENNKLNLPDEKFDLVLLILSFHDIYYVDDKNGWPKIDGEKMLTEIISSMKPGAVLGVVDHVAQTNAPIVETAQNLHRIDPAIIKRDLIRAGFVFDGESDVLRNPQDDISQSMFAEGIRGKTDRVIYRFKKP